MSQLVAIGRCDNLLEAQQMLDVLSDAGVDAKMFDPNMGALLPHVGAIGVRVMVREEDVERAKAALEESHHLPRGPHADLPDEGPKKA